MTPIDSDSPVVYPSITAGGRQYQLRFSYGAWFQLQQWGCELGNPKRPIPILALAAAAAGEVDPATGRWRTAGFSSPLEFADMMLDGESVSAFEDPVLEALKKVAPEAKAARNPAVKQAA